MGVEDVPNSLSEWSWLSNLISSILLLGREKVVVLNVKISALEVLPLELLCALNINLLWCNNEWSDLVLGLPKETLPLLLEGLIDLKSLKIILCHDNIIGRNWLSNFVIPELWLGQRLWIALSVMLGWSPD